MAAISSLVRLMRLLFDGHGLNVPGCMIRVKLMEAVIYYAPSSVAAA